MQPPTTFLQAKYCSHHPVQKYVQSSLILSIARYSIGSSRRAENGHASGQRISKNYLEIFCVQYKIPTVSEQAWGFLINPPPLPPQKNRREF